MENHNDKSTMYLYETQGDVMLVSYLVLKKKIRKKEYSSFANCALRCKCYNGSMEKTRCAFVLW